MRMDSQLVWAPDATDGYVLGRVVDLGPNKIATIRLENITGSGQKKIECSIENVFPAEVDLRKDYDDNCSLMFLNEANLLHNVRLRYFQNKIYTYVANILIALNPYHDLREQLYSGKVLQSYQGKSLGKMPPHVFAIADKAYHDMKRMSHSQSIIVSGESGAGKTESTKYILRYICESFGGPQSGSATQIEHLILEANPLLEAFGNAKTARNNNSSRFGKFIEIHMNRKCAVAGGHISHYLLEKSRICGISSPLERNYHIFYQLCVGAPKELWHRLKLKPPDQFSYLNKGCTRYFLTKKEDQQLAAERKSDHHRRDGHLEDSIVNDLYEFARMDRALDHFGVPAEDKMTIYQIVAAVLHLGNVNFEESPDASHGGCRVRQDDPGSQEALQNASELLGVDADQLQQCLQTRIMQTNKGGYKGSTYMVPLKVHEAQNARDALAKAIYSRLFDHIVMKIINRALPMVVQNGDGPVRPDATEAMCYIGVLDIAGFEYFQTNSFEQFCINYCNEKLQNFFNERILNDEQQLYENEGLGLKRIDYVDNRDCIELFEAKGSGIFDLLDEESRLPKPSAQHFTETVHHRNRGGFRLDIPRKSKLKTYRELRDDEGFIIRHFAGAVCYQTGQFIEKNNDSLHTNLAFLMLESNNQMLKSFFQSDVPATATNSAHNSFHSTSLADKSVRLSSESVGSKFRKQLADLMRRLDATGTHFVRCIKPNLNMVAKRFDGGCILSQLKCSGMTTVLQLMQYGFPSRATYSQIYELYAPRLPARLRTIESRFFCHALIKAVGLRDQDVRFGVTKVFFRPGRFAEFDMLMKNDDPAMLDQLVKKVQHWLIASRWRRAQWCALSVIKLKNKILYRRHCIIIIQKYIRMYLALKRYRPHFQSVKLIRQTRDHLQTIHPLVAKIQSSDDRKPFVEELESLNKTMDQLQSKCVVPGSDPRILDKTKVDADIRNVRIRIDTLVSNLKQALNQQELRLKAVQEALEEERRKQQKEEERRREQEELRRKKAELEERKRQEMEQQEQQRAKMAAAEANRERSAAGTSLVMLNEEERRRQIEYLKRLEQERRDYELALRLAQDHGAGAAAATGNDEIQHHYAMNVKQSSRQTEPEATSVAAKKYKLESWNYAQLRDTINTSNDIELLEACREEFHRRLKVYHQWKYRTNNSNNRTSAAVAEEVCRRAGKPPPQSVDTRAPGSVMNPFYDAMQQQQQQMLAWTMDGGNYPISGDGAEQQRYFRLPFDRQCGQSKGIWYAHFDGRWIARQMEIHPEKEPILLVAGRDDLKMCELSLEETGLTRKRMAEILPEEFEAVWSRNGGQPYRTRSGLPASAAIHNGSGHPAPGRTTMAAAGLRQ